MPAPLFQPGYDPRRPAVPGRHHNLRTILEQRFGKGTDDAWDYLASVLNGTAESVQEKVLSDGRIVEVRTRPTITERAAAAELIIAYAHGRPTQNAVIRAETTPAALEDNELAERVKGILDRAKEARTVDASFTELPAPQADHSPLNGREAVPETVGG